MPTPPTRPRTLLVVLLALAAGLLPGCDSFLFFGDSESTCDAGDLECYCDQNPENCE